MIRKRRDGKVPKYTHSHWELEYRGVKAVCAENGIVTLTQEHEDETYDEVKVSANMIFKLQQMLNASKNIEFVEPGEGRE